MKDILEILEPGTYGNLIVYNWKGKKCVRTKGNTGNQAPVAKIQASVLGKASGISAKLRAAFKPVIADPGNRKLMYRLNNALQQWLRRNDQFNSDQLNEISFLKGFSFSEGTDGNIFHSAMPVSRTAEGQLSIHIPAFDSPNPISPLPFEGKIYIHIIAAACNIVNPADTKSVEEIIDIDYTGEAIPARALLLPLQTSQGNLSVVAVSINGKAAGIVGGFWN